jgi:hypothetical protein
MNSRTFGVMTISRAFCQNIAEALLFYHPAVWWVSEQIRAERELCCDDLAVAVSGDVLTYARALAKLEAQRSPRLSPCIGGQRWVAREPRSQIDRASSSRHRQSPRPGNGAGDEPALDRRCRCRDGPYSANACAACGAAQSHGCRG